MTSDEKQADVVVIEGKKKSKKKKVTWKCIVDGIYDREQGTILGRTGKDWGLLLIFFILFYVVLFGYFTLLLFIFISGIMTPNVPFRSGLNSLLGNQPAINFRPLLDNATNIIALSTKINSPSFLSYVNLANFYLSVMIPPVQPNGVSCDNNPNPMTPNSACIFNLSKLGQCSNVLTELSAQRVCIFLRINNLYGWLPSVQNPSVTKDMLISCVGVNSTDVANVGPINYYPSTSFSGVSYGVFQNVYYPYLNQSTYWSPIVAAEFMNITLNMQVTVNCSISNVANIQSSTIIKFRMTNV